MSDEFDPAEFAAFANQGDDEFDPDEFDAFVSSGSASAHLNPQLGASGSWDSSNLMQVLRGRDAPYMIDTYGKPAAGLLGGLALMPATAGASLLGAAGIGALGGAATNLLGHAASTAVGGESSRMSPTKIAVDAIKEGAIGGILPAGLGAIGKAGRVAKAVKAPVEVAQDAVPLSVGQKTGNKALQWAESKLDDSDAALELKSRQGREMYRQVDAAIDVPNAASTRLKDAFARVPKSTNDIGEETIEAKDLLRDFYRPNKAAIHDLPPGRARMIREVAVSAEKIAASAAKSGTTAENKVASAITKGVLGIIGGAVGAATGQHAATIKTVVGLITGKMYTERVLAKALFLPAESKAYTVVQKLARIPRELTAREQGQLNQAVSTIARLVMNDALEQGLHDVATQIYQTLMQKE